MQPIEKQSALSNINARSESERYINRLHMRLFAILIFIIQGGIRLYSLLLNKHRSQSAIIMYTVTFVLLGFTILLIGIEYFLFKCMKYKPLKYTKIIDAVFYAFFLTEWLTTLSIPLTDTTFRQGEYLKIYAVWTYTAFAWRLLLQNFIVTKWYIKIIGPIAANTLLMVLTIHYEPTKQTYDLMRGISQTVFIVLIIFFEHRMSWNLILLNLHQAKWIQVNEFILDNIPENLAIFDLDGGVKYLSAYFSELMKQSNCDHDVVRFFENINDIQKYEIPRSSPFLKNAQTEAEESSPGHNNLHTEINLNTEANVNIEVPVRHNSLQTFLNDFKKIAKKNSAQDRSFIIFNGKLNCEDQEEKSIEIKASFIQQQNLQYILLIIRDTTQRDRLITLESNDKYKDQLLASVSHELRTPLNGSINLIESTLMSKEVPSTIKEKLLTPALRSCKFLLHLINDILDMSQIKAHKLRLVYQEASLKETLKNTIQLVSLQAKRKGLKLEIDIDSSIPENLCTDHARFSQIVLNLMNNSIKFTLEGFVKITVKPSDLPNVLKITVEDSGMGMDKGDLCKLFKKFTHIEHQSRETINPTGAGLGLSIAYNLAELLGPPHNQGITVTSTPGIGSSFTFELENRKSCLSIAQSNKNEDELDPQDPMYIPDEYCSETAVTLETKLKTQMISRLSKMRSTLTLETKCACPKVLIVDDDQFNIFAFEVILNSFHIKYDAVFTGKTALEKLQNKRRFSCGITCKAYQLIFMDREMPLMDGSQTVKEIKRLQLQGLLKKDIAIIGCTAHNDKHEIENFISCGLDDCITKPISRDRVSEILVKFDALTF